MTIPARRVLRLVQSPNTPVVKLAEAKAQLRVEHAEDDALISGYLAAAQERLEGPNGLLGRSLLNTTWQMDIPGFWPHEWTHEPLARLASFDHRPSLYQIDLPLAGVSAVSAVTYYDRNGDAQTLPPDDYQLVTDNRFVAHLSRKPGLPWPCTQCRDDAVTIAFTSGFGADPSNVPSSIRSALLLMIMDLYESGDDAKMPDLSPAVLSLTEPYRRRAL